MLSNEAVVVTVGQAIVEVKPQVSILNSSVRSPCVQAVLICFKTHCLLVASVIAMTLLSARIMHQTSHRLMYIWVMFAWAPDMPSVICMMTHTDVV